MKMSKQHQQSVWLNLVCVYYVPSAQVRLKQNPRWSEPEFFSSIQILQSVYEQTLHHFSMRALPIWKGLKASSNGFEKQKQINRGDPREIRLWYPGLQPGNTPISLRVTWNMDFFFFFFSCGWMLVSLWLSADPSGFLWCVISQRQCVIFPSKNIWVALSCTIHLQHHNSFKHAALFSVVLNTDICI